MTVYFVTRKYNPKFHSLVSFSALPFVRHFQLLDPLYSSLHKLLTLADSGSKTKMAAEKLVRDIGDVYSKLFNHHGPIQREVNFYVQEFETKRKEREISRLNQASVNCSHIETLLPEVESLSKEHIQTVFDRTENAIKKANVMLENKLPEENAEKVEDRRARMEQEWKAFEEKTNSSREVAEQCHIERMEKLKEDIKRLNEEIKGK